MHVKRPVVAAVAVGVGVASTVAAAVRRHRKNIKPSRKKK